MKQTSSLLFWYFSMLTSLVFAQKTQLSINGNQFYINGKPTYEGRYWNGHKVEGLLINSRMVQGVFDDLNVATRDTFAYTDTKIWDPERNNKEFVAAMPIWKSYGLIAITVNMQGGSPFGYGNFDFFNPGFNADGSLNYTYMNRLDRILKKADEIEMVVILGLFYFGQDQRMVSEAAIKRAVTEMVNWLHQKKYRNVLIEICNETLPTIHHYDHEILLSGRIHELIILAQSIEKDGYRYPVSVSFPAQALPTPEVVKHADYLLFHCNALRKFEKFENHLAGIRRVLGDRHIPVMINEDDNYHFDADTSHFKTAIENYISWGYFDYRKKEDTDLRNGFQTVPVDWGIHSENKKAFFSKVKEITGTIQLGDRLQSQDFIYFEAESTTSELDQWKFIKKGDANFVPGANGKGHLEFTGNNPSLGPPASPLTYTFTAAKDGNFRLLIMASKRLEGLRGDLCNDTYVKLSGDFESANELEKKELENYIKFFQDGSTKTPGDSWHWAYRAERGKHEFFDLTYALKKGQQYHLTIAGRSQRFNFDYLVLYDSDKIGLNEARELFAVYEE